MNGLVYHLPLEMLHTLGGRSNLFALYIALCPSFDKQSICTFLCKHLDLFFFFLKESLLVLLHCLIKLVHSDLLDFCLDVGLKSN